jgi:hypothetical protein
LARVSSAVVLSFLGIFVGLILLVIPGIYLMLRWIVVAQSASLGEREWGDALERSGELTRGFKLHVLGVLVLLILVQAAVSVPIRLVFGFHPTTASQLVDIPIGVLLTSFGALALALLYFDLQARFLDQLPPPPPAPIAPAPGPTVAPEPTAVAAALAGDPLDHGRWSDEERPAGWYVVPAAPHRMRYWIADPETRGWSERSTRTPRKVLTEWRDREEGR